ncbi:hypothetical protein DSO57_1019935 [Entomophthora muscae]|uniref:Uncharacterized protein n=1 Tax=Entomophthora muscae TaxID=34485 RepID=A0ACC2S5Z9_9FUNG|nr:hypothetical protein DSO57_1019935 [Entomophthora muscae]
MEPITTEIMSIQLFEVLYITLIGLVASMVPTSGPWSLLGCSSSEIIKLAPILWWALPIDLAAPCPESPNASTYAWLPDRERLGGYTTATLPKSGVCGWGFEDTQ